MTGTDPSGAVPDPRAELVESQPESDAADLQESLRQLAALVTGSLGLRDVLAHVATFAVRAIPGADGAGVTLLSADRGGSQVQVLASSHPFVAEIDEIQYVTLNEGPCITAALERRTVRSGSLGGEMMWPRFGPRVGRLGVHSALSLPLMLSERTVGAINVYSRAKDAFDDRAAELGELFAAPAAVAVHNAQILAQAQELTAQLQTALSSRPIIDQAIGILRGRSGGSADEAFGRLRTISQADHVKLVDVAQHIVDEAVRRARARHAQP
ncbi:MAG TPA: GAF and ANTAR domain-containing protein [Candidatus Nanopelagicales bacterium]|jgi:GAF domain-containing protein